ncbi:hypothetical protein GGG17_06660 [Arsenicicoccus sp. MKL-02]|uniref:DUF6318 domain-containing protein n=1 Tax=Arsenicicoccus cauae TaxID=2663847 RepID=A0A6I3I635_9MICO|nr:DUF6318 family protein [Arsenicicoccus cauae]MTB71654.1 hypothetical protein [Arsenicicoccus cauae]
MRGHGRLLTAAALTAAGLLTGCSGATTSARTTATHELPPTASGTTAGSATTPPTSATPTTAPAAPSSPATTTAATPAIPAAARAHTPEGAEAFTRYFIDQVNVAWTTPKTGLISALSLPTCKSCAKLEKDAQRLADADARVASPMLEVTETVPAEDKQTGATVVVATVQETPTPTVQDGATTQSTRKTTVTRRAFELSAQANGWRVSEIKDYQ